MKEEESEWSFSEWRSVLVSVLLLLRRELEWRWKEDEGRVSARTGCPRLQIKLHHAAV